jgi:hypothetical protein
MIGTNPAAEAAETWRPRFVGRSSGGINNKLSKNVFETAGYYP